MAFASKEIISIFNKVKYPYNVNILTQKYASQFLDDRDTIDRNLSNILKERGLLQQALSTLPYCQKVYPSDANFFLVRVNEAQRVYDYLVEMGIIVRNRSRVQMCDNCLRITIGSRSENNELIGAMRNFK